MCIAHCPPTLFSSKNVLIVVVNFIGTTMVTVITKLQKLLSAAVTVKSRTVPTWKEGKGKKEKRERGRRST